MGGAGGGQSSSKSSTSVPKFQRKYLTDLYQRGQDEVANQPLEFYGGPTVASQDPATLDYYGRALDYSQNGNAALNQAGAYNSDVLSGKYLAPESNPYLRGTYDEAARAVTDNYQNAVLPAITSRFARSGNSLSGQFLGAGNRATQALGNSLGDLATNIYGGAYDAERGRQDSARGFSATLADDQANRIGLQGQVGEQKQAYAQSLIDELIARFDFAQNEPAQRLSRYAGLLGNPITLSNSSSKAWNAQLGINGSLPGL